MYHALVYVSELNVFASLVNSDMARKAGTTLHDLMDPIRDAPKEYQKLWAEEQEFRQAVSEVLEAR